MVDIRTNYHASMRPWIFGVFDPMKKQFDEKMLSQSDRDALIQELIIKLQIFINGAKKRNKDVRQEKIFLEKLKGSSF